MPEQSRAAQADDELIERIAVQMAVNGLGRLEGRICAAIALHPEPRITMGELCDRLGATKSYVSTTLRRLIERGWVERVPVFGSRRDAYELLPDGFNGTQDRSLEEICRLRDLLHEAVLTRTTPLESHQRLVEYRDFMATLAEEFPAFMERVFARIERGDVPTLDGS